MKTYKKLSLLIILAFLSTNIVFAQDRPQGSPPIPNDEQIEEMVKDLAKEISLTNEQEEQVSDLYVEHFEKVAAQQEKNKGSRGAGREAMGKLTSDLEDSVNALLTKDQKKLYEAYLKEQKSKRGQGRQGRPQERDK